MGFYHPKTKNIYISIKHINIYLQTIHLINYSNDILINIFLLSSIIVFFRKQYVKK